MNGQPSYKSRGQLPPPSSSSEGPPGNEMMSVELEDMTDNEDWAAIGELEVNLPRLKLDFLLKKDGRLLESKQFRGMVVSECQSFGSLTGLVKKLVLNVEGSSRSVIVPYGNVSFSSDANHVRVTIDTSLAKHFRYHSDDSSIMGALRADSFDYIFTPPRHTAWPIILLGGLAQRRPFTALVVLPPNHKLSNGARELQACCTAKAVDDWSVSLPVCPGLLSEIESWGKPLHNPGSEDELTLGFDVKWLDPLEEFLPDNWCRFQNILSRNEVGKDKYRIMIFLSSLAYSEHAKQGLVQTLLAFATIPKLQMLQPPKHSVFLLAEGLKREAQYEAASVLSDEDLLSISRQVAPGRARLTASLCRHLLWERKQKNQTASAVLKRRHTAHDVANLKQYPDKVYLGKEDKGDHGSWNQYFQGDGGYHSK
ncbi:hypothetical protein VE03_10892, partial [Pseudogymnoascus sp. 23342-1-I1]